MLAFTQTAPMIIVFWVPDLACYLLRIPEDRYLRLVPVHGSAATVWALVLSTAGITATERVSWRRGAARGGRLRDRKRPGQRRGGRDALKGRALRRRWDGLRPAQSAYLELKLGLVAMRNLKRWTRHRLV